MRSDGDRRESFGEFLSGDRDSVGEGFGSKGWVLDGGFLSELTDVGRRGFGEPEP